MPLTRPRTPCPLLTVILSPLLLLTPPHPHPDAAFPNRLYGFVNFMEKAAAAKAFKALHGRVVPLLTGTNVLCMDYSFHDSEEEEEGSGMGGGDHISVEHRPNGGGRMGVPNSAQLSQAGNPQRPTWQQRQLINGSGDSIGRPANGQPYANGGGHMGGVPPPPGNWVQIPQQHTNGMAQQHNNGMMPPVSGMRHPAHFNNAHGMRTSGMTWQQRPRPPAPPPRQPYGNSYYQQQPRRHSPVASAPHPRPRTDTSNGYQQHHSAWANGNGMGGGTTNGHLLTEQMLNSSVGVEGEESGGSASHVAGDSVGEEGEMGPEEGLSGSSEAYTDPAVLDGSDTTPASKAVAAWPSGIDPFSQRCCAPGCTVVDPYTLRKCTGCLAVAYCCHECQLSGWEAGHMDACAALRALRDMPSEGGLAAAVPVLLMALDDPEGMVGGAVRSLLKMKVEADAGSA
jgi:hypothetical protein